MPAADGEWQSLLSAESGGIWESKWCANRFIPFLVLDPDPDESPGAREAEELIGVHTVTVAEVHALVKKGELAVCSVVSITMALARLSELGYDVSS